MYVSVELYFNSEFCASANPMRIMHGIMMKKAKIKMQLEKDNNGTG